MLFHTQKPQDNKSLLGGANPGSTTLSPVIWSKLPISLFLFLHCNVKIIIVLSHGVVLALKLDNTSKALE